MWPNPQEIADLVTFTEKILNGKLQCSANTVKINNSNFNLDYKIHNHTKKFSRNNNNTFINKTDVRPFTV